MKIPPEQIIIPVTIAVGVGALFYWLNKSNGPALVTSPNTDASGQPVTQTPALAYNIGTRSPAPSPDLIYGPPPALPGTPLYQSYNQAPGNLFTLTPEGAQSALATPASDTPGDSCCCGPSSQGTFQDGALLVGVAANPSEQVRGMSQTQADNLAKNIASSAMSNDGFVWSQIANLAGSVPTQF